MTDGSSSSTVLPPHLNEHERPPLLVNCEVSLLHPHGTGSMKVYTVDEIHNHNASSLLLPPPPSSSLLLSPPLSSTLLLPFTDPKILINTKMQFVVLVHLILKNDGVNSSGEPHCALCHVSSPSQSVVEHTHMSPEMFTLYLHQNYIDFYEDIDDVVRLYVSLQS